MFGNDDSSFIANILRPLSAYYGREGVEEVAINQPEIAWVKMQGEDWVKEDAPELTYRYLYQVCKTLANRNQTRFSDAEPSVSCNLPTAQFRFQGLMGPNVYYNSIDQRGVGIALRSLVARTMPFSRWGFTSEATLEGVRHYFEDFAGMTDHIAKLQKVIDSSQTIIISGATSTGKTTFTNQVVRMIHPKARLIAVEDTKELTLQHENHLHLYVPRNHSNSSFNWNSAINALMRLTPDWVICGELSVENAEATYSLMGKGHPVITTVHAGTPEQAIRAFINNMSSNGSALAGKESTLDDLESKIGCIVQITRDVDGTRRVSDIVFPANEKNREASILAEMHREELEKKSLFKMQDQKK